MPQPTEEGFVGLGEEYAPQPFYAHCDLYILNESLLPEFILTGGRYDPYQASEEAKKGAEFAKSDFAFTLQNWTHTLEVLSFADSFIVSMLDTTYEMVEIALAKYGQSLGFQYYYVDAFGQKLYPSPLYRAVVLDWTPEPTMAGTNITVQCVGILGNTVQNSVTWAGPDGPLNLSEVVLKVADGAYQEGSGLREKLRKPWAVDFGGFPPEAIQELQGTQKKALPATEQMEYMLQKSTSLAALAEQQASTGGQISPKLYTQMNQSDLEFLRWLADRCLTSGKAGGYTVSLDDKPTQPILHFHPRRENEPFVASTDDKGNPKFRTPRLFTYLYGFTNTEVIRFVPQVSVSFMAADGGEVAKPYFNPITETIGMIIASVESDPKDRTINPEFTNTVANITSRIKEAGRAAVSAVNIYTQSGNYVEASREAYNMWYERFLYGSKAELEIVGDPTVRPMDVIKILCIAPSGTILLVSGHYQIDRVTNRGSNGQWTTTMELSRVGLAEEVASSSNVFANVKDIKGTQEASIVHKHADGRHADYAFPSGRGIGDTPGIQGPGNLQSPICGILGDEFGASRAGGTRKHRGIDIVPGGSNVSFVSSVNGKVTKVYTDGSATTSGGHTMQITNAEGTLLFHYSHLPEVYISMLNTTVTAGQPIADSTGKEAKVGKSGDATGVHLHLQIMDLATREWIDPLLVVARPNPC